MTYSNQYIMRDQRCLSAFHQVSSPVQRLQSSLISLLQVVVFLLSALSCFTALILLA